MVSLDLYDNTVTVSFPYSEEQVSAIKHITSDFSKRIRAWRVSPSRIEEIYHAFPDVWTSPRLQKWIELQRELEAQKREDAPQPHWVGRALFPHQKSAVRYLSNFEKCGLFGPPGTAKTAVAITWALRIPGPRLVVCPAAVKYHWVHEIRECDPKAEIFIVQATSGPMVAPAQWSVINYDILASRMKDLPEFSTLLGDETQMISQGRPESKKDADKPPKGSKRGNAVLKLAEHTKNVLFMTGSPVLNRPVELEPTLIALGKLSPRERFPWRIRFCQGERVLLNPMGVKYHNRAEKWAWQFKGSSNVELLSRELSTFSVRWTLDEIGGCLPPVTHTLLEIDLPDLGPHEEMRAEMKRLLKSSDPLARGQALAMMGRMIQWTGEQKVRYVADAVQERLSAGESPVVFSDFLAPLAALRERFKGECLMLDGTMPQEKREIVKQYFLERPGACVLLASRRATGTGLDGLQHKARTCIFHTLPWNPAGFQQAYGRLARTGQRHPVEVITTVARGTVDEAVLEIIYRKAKVTDVLCSSPSLSESAKKDWESVLGLLGGLQ